MVRGLITVAVAAVLLALPASAQAASPLDGTAWTFKRIEGRKVPRDFLGELRFFTHKRWTGQDDCNGIAGRYRGTGSRLRFPEIQSTLRGCDFGPDGPPPSVNAVLHATRSYHLTPGRLLLLDRRGHWLARLAPRH